MYDLSQCKSPHYLSHFYDLKTQRYILLTSSSRSTHTMNIVSWPVWNIVVDDQVNCWNVKSSNNRKKFTTNNNENKKVDLYSAFLNCRLTVLYPANIKINSTP